MGGGAVARAWEGGEEGATKRGGQGEAFGEHLFL